MNESCLNVGLARLSLGPALCHSNLVNPRPSGWADPLACHICCGETLTIINLTRD